MSKSSSHKHSVDLDRIPTRPGVYLFKAVDGEVLYVGKAKSLRSRIRSYFRKDTPSTDFAHSLKTRELVRRIESVETIVVGSEAEALILEANLIKERSPRFNIQLRDDKSYPYVKVTTKERFPRVYVTRRVVNDGNQYFGPYTSVGAVRRALELIKRLYTVRSCRYRLPEEAPSRACLDYHIGRCKAPCVGLQTEGDYRVMIEEILGILSGDTEEIRREVEERMHQASEGLDFETAARHRDVLHGLGAIGRRQRVQQVGGGDQDVVGLARDGDQGVAVVLKVRGGTLLGRDGHQFSGVGSDEDSTLLSGFASRYYLGRGEAGREDLPSEVLVPLGFPDRETLEEVLTGRAGRRVRFHQPKRGDKYRLLGLAGENARSLLEERRTGGVDAIRTGSEEVLYALQDELDLKVVPRLMACFDVSHIQGSETVASVAVFENGEPKKAEYRHMRVKGDWGNDDYRSMEEAVGRYFRRRLEEGGRLPDLTIIDGGKGQLSSAVAALNTLNVEDVQMIALAKKEEEVYLPERAEAIRMDRRDRPLHLLQRIRDEAHRFAVSYNRKLRRKRTLGSDLSNVPGIGPGRQRALLKRFGSVKGIREATVEEVAEVPGLSRVLAARILAYLGR